MSIQNSTDGTSNGVPSFFDETELMAGSKYFFTPDLDVAICLVTLGFKVRRHPPVSVVKNPDGIVHTKVSFNVTSDCGKYTTDAFMAAYKHDAKYCNENPDCPMAYVIAAVKNKSSMIKALGEITPTVYMRKSQNSGPVIGVVENSEKHKNCLLKGMVHVNPDCIIKYV